MNEWYLVYCKARQEDWPQGPRRARVCASICQIARQDERRLALAGLVEIIQPLFPRYLFVSHLTMQEQSISPVRIHARRPKTGCASASPTCASYRTGMIDGDCSAREDPETGYHRLTAAQPEAGRPRTYSDLARLPASRGYSRLGLRPGPGHRAIRTTGPAGRTEIAIEELELITVICL